MIEAVVVGGGIVGSATALELADRGVAVNLVEAERCGAGATGASAGMLAPQYESPGPGPLFDLGVEARDRYAAFVSTVEELGGTSLHLRRDGMLVANAHEAEHAAALRDATWQTAAGRSARVLTPGEAAELRPGLGPAFSWLWLPDEGQIDTQALLDALSGAVTAAGVRLITGHRVEGLLSRGERAHGVVLDDGRTLSADVVVLAAGARSGRVEGLPREIPVKPVRGQMLRYPSGLVGGGPLVSDHHGRYLVPRSDGTLLAGSTMEHAGFDRSVTEEGARAIRSTATGLVPALAGASPVEHWAGLRPLSEDRAPILGPDPDMEGLFYATGHGRSGILLGPISGRIIAELVVEGEPELDWMPFGIGRFG